MSKRSIARRKLKVGQRFTAIIPWQINKDGSKYIELEPGVFITPETDIQMYDKPISKKVIGDEPEAQLTSEGLIMYTTINDKKIIDQIIQPYSHINSMSCEVLQSDSDDSKSE
jgi:hypothetical protein